MPKATLVHEYHKKFRNGMRVDIIIWKLPQATNERPHGLKYRLNYSLRDGSTLVRYDNETGKADHKHIGGKQLPYMFTSIQQLFADFKADVLGQGGKLW